ncbi:MAG: thioredoxin family protein [Verrucomicrobiales bacterium]
MKKHVLLIALPLLALTAALAMPVHAATSSLKILKFEADWCGACQQMKPIFSSVSKSSPAGVSFQSINVDTQTALAEQYKVELLPTVVAVKNGKVVGRSTGYMSAAKLKSFIKKHQ